MQSHPVKRVVSGALAATAVIAAVSFAHAPATAEPTPVPQTPPSDTSEALAEYRKLAEKAAKLNEDHLNAEEDLKAKKAELEQANADLAAAEQAGTRASADVENYRTEVDKFAGASFTSGAGMNKLSALLTGESTQDFLQRAAALDVLASDRNEALRKLSGVVDEASRAQRKAAQAQARAQAAKEESAKLAGELRTRKDELDAKVEELKEAAGLLSSADRAVQRDTGGPIPNVKAPGPAAQTAVDAALGKIGSAYRLGAEGPSTFDCSGLTSWAYQQAGIGIPRTARTQQTFGTPIARSQLQPGDLVFYGRPAHHVGMYIGGGRMVHSPQPGDVVKISPLQSNYTGARRVA
ncbi:C40 family peptidase [Amycolatopsis cihanbeyliensis]|uniref:C40 family peptidase n=1 Tax=Amycolatopsis cihanbeyliensis TaxID=1128664 RepID=UPI0011549F3C|nr:C40 family peptidase [Amycolatopsis cihanbeyliensis]